MPQAAKTNRALGSSNGNSTRQPEAAKRKAPEWIDLTGDDDDEPARKLAKPSASTSAAGSLAHAQLDPWDVDDVSDAEVINLSQDADGLGDPSLELLELYGSLKAKVVGIQYYNGHFTSGEYVLVRREPTNRFDHNAIWIGNMRRAQIGHIPRAIAAKLAPYMDSGSLVVSGRLDGQRGEYDVPIILALYGSNDPVVREDLKNRMARDRLPLDAINSRDKEAKKKRAAELKMASKQASMVGWSQLDLPGHPGSSGAPAPTMEDIIAGSQYFNPREIGEVVEKYGVGEDELSKLPMMDAPKRLNTELLPYQRQGLAWLVDRESPKLPVAGSSDIVQLWKRSLADSSVFTNIATNFSVKNELPKLASGGVLADDMGLGKTLQIIALILADQDRGAQTLIICPVSVMSNWSGQIARHVNPKKPLRVLTYHGSSRKSLNPRDFAEYDVVISTYGTLSTEYLAKGKQGNPEAIPRRTGLFSLNWRRVVLDEGHVIRNPSSKISVAATSVLAHSRWVLTGTPIVNGLKDLYSLMKFIGLTGGLERLEVFNAALMRPLKAGHPDATLLLQALMGTLCLRRRKDMAFVDLRLPQLREYVHRIQFTDSEKKKYGALLAEAKGLLAKYQNRQETGDGKKAQETYRHMLEILLRLRQVCNHWKLCGERITSLMSVLESQKVVELTPENRHALQEVLRLSIESQEDCPICLEALQGHGPVITHCAHAFGADCINRVIETQHKCPMCRAELEDETCLVQPAAGLGESNSDQMDVDIDTSSSKIEALLSILKAAHQKPGTKVIVFSQWCRFLDIVQKQLDEHQYGFTRIDGTMSVQRRDQALEALNTDPNCTVMLASLGVCAVGLNLVAANQVILCDSWWAPAIEDQAIDRVHRLGQTKETTVFRLVMEGSVEEHTLQIQAEKRKLMMAAFGEKTSKRNGGKSARLGDIRRLLA